MTCPSVRTGRYRAEHSSTPSWRATTSTPTASASSGVRLGGPTHPDSPAATSGSRHASAYAAPIVSAKNWDALPALTHETFTVRSRSADEDERQRLGGDADDGRPHLGLPVPRRRHR